MCNTYGTLIISTLIVDPGQKDTKGNPRVKSVNLYTNSYIKLDEANSCVSDFLFHNKYIHPSSIKCEWVARIRIEPE